MFNDLFKDYAISESDINRIKDYIITNELEIHINENNILRFFISTEDGFIYQFYKISENYVIVEITNKGHARYHNFNNLQQFLEQLAYTESLKPKVYWTILDSLSSASMVFKNENYNNEWANYIMSSNDWRLEDSYNFHGEEEYKYLVYEKEVNMSVISPFNKLHEVSPLNKFNPDKIGKLYFEIHPISLREKEEKYLLKILINNDPIFKEYINYSISKKKGLKLFLEELFNNINPYVIFLNS